MTEFKLDHKITEEDVKKLNELLEGSGWSVGRLFLEAFYLDSDIKRAGKYGYSMLGDDIEEGRRLYQLKADLEQKQARIYQDFKEEEKHD